MPASRDRFQTRNPRHCGSKLRRLLLAGALFAQPLALHAGGWADLWLTPDQQGQRLAKKGEFLAAAEAFEDPRRKGAAFFRGGDFERASAVFGRIDSAEAAYNRGNALVMLGQYDGAIRSYEDALARRPGWVEAEENLAIARARKQRLAPPEDDAGGTGGMLEADEIVFDDSGRVQKSGAEAVTAGGEALSDDEMRAVWLRRVQNDPKDFLRTRFAYQLYRDQEEGRGDADR